MLVASCTEPKSDSKVSKSIEINFVSSLINNTRISSDVEGDSWVEGDLIGLYMLVNNSTTIIDYQNIPLVAQSSSQTTTFGSEQESVYYPIDAIPVDFVAYYPYNTSVADSQYSIDLADQSKGFVKHDLIWAKANNGGSGYTYQTVEFKFAHQLSKISLQIVDPNGNALATSQASICGSNTQASFNIMQGELSGYSSSGDIVMCSGEVGSFDAVILPTIVDKDLIISLNVDGNSYNWNIFESYSNLDIKAGYSYTFKVTVDTSESQLEAILVTNDGSSISPWGDGGADNVTVPATDDYDIPSDFELISLASGESVKTAIEGASSSKVAIELRDSGEYSESSFTLPSTISSLMIVGQGGTVMPIFDISSAMKLSSDLDQLLFYNVAFTGTRDSGYVINQSSEVHINTLTFDSCSIDSVRGVVRLQSASSTIGVYTIYNSILNNIGNYNALTVEAGAIVNNIELTNSTFNNFEGRAIYLNNASSNVSSDAVIEDCTFNLGPQYAVIQFSTVGGTLIYNNNIVGLPYSSARGVSVASNASSVDESNNYYVSDTVWSSTAIGSDCGYTAEELFKDADNCDFTQSKLEAGDPRWRK